MKLTPHTLILVQLWEGIYALADRLGEKTQSASPKGIKGPFIIVVVSSSVSCGRQRIGLLWGPTR